MTTNNQATAEKQVFTLEQIKQWFRTGLRPTQQQFWDAFESLRHKGDKISISDIEGLENASECEIMLQDDIEILFNGDQSVGFKIRKRCNSVDNSTLSGSGSGNGTGVGVDLLQEWADKYFTFIIPSVDLQSLYNKNNEQDNRMGAIEQKNVQQDANITTEHNKNVDQDGKIISLESFKNLFEIDSFKKGDILEAVEVKNLSQFTKSVKEIGPYGSGGSFSHLVSDGKNVIIIRQGIYPSWSEYFITLYEIDEETGISFISEITPAFNGYNISRVCFKNDLLILGITKYGGSGTIKIYSTLNGVITLKATISKPSTANVGFGRSFDFDGVHLIVTDRNEWDPNIPKIFVYSYINDSFNLVQTIDAPSDILTNSAFGYEVATNNGLLVVSAVNFNFGGIYGESGKCYIYNKNTNGLFELIQDIQDVSLSNWENFGESIIINDGELIIADSNAQTNGHGSGAVHIVKKVNGIWTIIYDLYHPLPDSSNPNSTRFGYNIALSNKGNFLLVSDNEYCWDNKDRGAIFIYKKISDVWTLLEEKLTSSVNLEIGSISGMVFGQDVVCNEDKNLIISKFDGTETKKVAIFSGINKVVFKNKKKGLNITESERTSLTDVEIGTQVYQTDGQEGIWVFKSTGWEFAY